MADGTSFARDMYILTGIKEGLIKLLRDCQPNTILLGGRAQLLYLGAKNVESAAIYVLENGIVTKIATAGGDAGHGKKEV